MRLSRVVRTTSRLVAAAVFSCGAATSALASQASESGPAPAGMDATRATLVYVGTTTADKGKGIYLFRLQTENLEVSQNITLVPLGLAAETANPSFLEIDPLRRLLFAVNEVEQFQGKPTGSVSAFSIDAATGRLTLLNQRSSMGTAPCQVILDKEGRHALVSNCGTGSLAVLPVGADGRLGEATSVVQLPAASGNPDLRGGSRLPCLTLDPANRFAFACDFERDQIGAYRFDAHNGTLTPSQPAFTSVKAGSGPRDMVFRPDGRFAYVVNELSSTISVFAYDANTGGLSPLQSLSTVPEYFDGANRAAELGIHPSGKYLYVSNRGHNSVVLFGVDGDRGTLTYIEEQGTGGRNPRHFGIEPSAKHLAIANQDSDTVLVARIDASNGRLKPSGVFASVPSPSFVRFLPPQEPKR